ncbi:UNVERIFIED_CONTAM: hypothetical protein Scaly_2285100 [Sesamum calycinum]|uniref:Exo_endo_phos domain-containing protein n=1 Tax=Sesamum calycinum TaxID=2727403 RepID=A0AAW2MDB2_9LAMI
MKRAAHVNCFVSFVYSANWVQERRDMWQFLVQTAEFIAEDCWLVLGDFNTVLEPSEICGRSGDVRFDMEEFNQCFNATLLTSLLMQGLQFSWHNCNMGERSLGKRLDRMLGNEVWFTQRPDCTYTCTHQRTSDHCPLVFTMERAASVKSMFRFGNFLMKDLAFLQTMATVWQHQMCDIVKKLKQLKPVFRLLRKRKGNMAQNVQMTAEFLAISQQLLQQ